MARRASGFVASLVDVGSASAATFVVGVVALRQLGDAEVALYALVFSAATALMILPQFGVYTLQRMHVNRQRDLVRPHYFADLKSAAPLAVLTCIGVCLAGLPLLHEVTVGSFAAVAATGAVWSVLSPWQDHIRTSLHVTGNHTRAALVSATNFFVVAGITSLVEWTGDVGESQPTAWLPFGMLMLGNAASIPVGIALHRVRPKSATRATLSFRESSLVSVPGLVEQSGNYIRNVVVAGALGPTALALLEGARIASQPVLMVATGLAAVFVPSAVRAVGVGNLRAAYRRVTRYGIAVGAGGVLFSGALVWLAPALGVVTGRSIPTGLAAARGLAATVGAIGAPLNTLNIAEKRYRLAIAASVTGEIAGLVVLATAIIVLGTYAVPVAVAVGAIAKMAVNMVARCASCRGGG